MKDSPSKLQIFALVTLDRANLFLFDIECLTFVSSIGLLPSVRYCLRL